MTAGATQLTLEEAAKPASQLDRVRAFMLAHGEYRTFREIIGGIGGRASEAAVSARLRDLRKEGLTVEKKPIARGVYGYRVSGTPARAF